MNRELARAVRDRARERCEYCRIPQFTLPLPFQVDHIIAEQHGEKSVLDNLASPARIAIVTKGRTSRDSIPLRVNSFACFTHVLTAGSGTFNSTGLELQGGPRSDARPFTYSQ